jgi:hypothetical protein
MDDPSLVPPSHEASLSAGHTSVDQGGEFLKLDARRGGGKHGVGSFPVRDVVGHLQQPGMYRLGRAVSTSPPNEPNAIRDGISDTCDERAASEFGRYN